MPTDYTGLTTGGAEKSAQDIMEALRRAGTAIGSKAQDAGKSLGNWYGGLDPEARSAMKRGLLGAAAGGLTVGGIRAMTPMDADTTRKKHVLGPAMLAALMGGAGAAALPAGLKMLSGGIRLPQERRPPPGSRLADSIVGPIVRNPATSAAAGLSAAGLASSPVAGEGADVIRKHIWSAANPKSGLSRAQRLQQLNPKHIAPNVSRAMERMAVGLSHDSAAEGASVVSKIMQMPQGPAREKAMRLLRKGKIGLYAIPALLAGGYLTDRYLKGQY